MGKIVTPLIFAAGAFLYFTYDAGFNFERASADNRAAFAERQAQNAVRKAALSALNDPRAIVVSADAHRVRVKVNSDGTMMHGSRRSDTLKRACSGYLGSHLGGHGIVLSLEFYNARSQMAGVLTLSPVICRRTVAMTV